jgi:hypothetical protein
MRNAKNSKFARLALVALMLTSFAVPLAASVTPASARGDGGGTGGTGGSTGGSAGGAGGAGCGGCSTPQLAILVPPPPPPRHFPRVKLVAGKSMVRNSCLKVETVYDRYGDDLGTMPRNECY